MKLLNKPDKKMFDDLFWDLSVKSHLHQKWYSINKKYLNEELSGTFNLAMNLPKDKKILYYNELKNLLNENSK